MQKIYYSSFSRAVFCCRYFPLSSLSSTHIVVTSYLLCLSLHFIPIEGPHLTQPSPQIHLAEDDPYFLTFQAKLCLFVLPVTSARYLRRAPSPVSCPCCCCCRDATNYSPERCLSGAWMGSANRPLQSPVT
jgi:hypothetical protein